MGEGWLANDMSLGRLPLAYTMAGQGEGILGGHNSRTVLVSPINAYHVAGLGEGWLAHGRPLTTIRAYPSDGRGEGWVGNGRP
jgi:hypothetical protein